MTKRVTHLITGLGMGGAEMMLWQVLKYGDTAAADLRVISLSGEGESQYYVEQIRALGISVTAVPLKRRPVSSVLRICKLLRKTDTLFCWMYHSNFLGYILGRMCHVKRIIWNIRHSDLSKEHNSAVTLRINRICAHLSHRVALVAYNGEPARLVHEAVGYAKDKGLILPNGCDCHRFSPDPQAPSSLRAELGIPDTRQILLSAMRYHPIKDHATFIRAFSVVHKRFPDSVVVMCGSGVTVDNHELTSLCLEYGLKLGEDVFLLGMRTDIPRLLAACDLYVQHSASEAFPNALLQAMACGCLCVATEVGATRQLLKNDAQLVRPMDPEALAEKIIAMLELPADQAHNLRKLTRDEVLEHYRIEKIAQLYEALYDPKKEEHASC